MLESIIAVRGDILVSLGQTFYMVSIALVFAIILGTILGLLLYVTENPLFVQKELVNKIIGVILNIIRSVPFLILMILLLPLSKLIVGTKIGSKAVIVPLAIASIAFLSFSSMLPRYFVPATNPPISSEYIILSLFLPGQASLKCFYRLFYRKRCRRL